MMRVVTQLELYLYAAGTGFAMYPMTKLVGAGAVSRINSILVPAAWPFMRCLSWKLAPAMRSSAVKRRSGRLPGGD